MKFLAVVLVSASLIACKSNSNSKRVEQKEELNASISSTNKGHEGHNHSEEKKSVVKKNSLAKFDFVGSSTYAFGEVKEGEMVEHVFKFTNTGTEPLAILDVKTSCGCTVPEYSKTPIAPGAEGELKVRFNTRGKRGSQNKKIRVFTNTEKKEVHLFVKGKVSPKPDLSNGPVRR